MCSEIKTKFYEKKKRDCRQINTNTKLIFVYSSFFYFDWLFVYNSFISKVLVNKNVVTCYIVGYVMILFLFFSFFFLLETDARVMHICKFSLLFLVKVEFISFFNWWKRRKHFHFKTCKITFNCTTFISNIKGFKSQIQETDLDRKKKIELSRHFNSRIQNIFSHKLSILY